MSRQRGFKASIDPRYSRFRLSVRKSRIHGLGVFAGTAIPQGRKVIEYTGQRLSARKANERFLEIWGPRGPKIDSLFRLNRYWSVDGAVGGSGAEKVNHSCEPNMKAKNIRGHIWYFSRRRILPGEELTLDYGFSPRARRVPCRCSSSTCRGSINRK